MDSSLPRITGGIVRGVRPAGRRGKGAGKQPGRRFSLEGQEEAEAPEPVEEPDIPEPRHIAPPDQEEVGGRLDLTA